jgi:hypothetical protein
MNGRSGLKSGPWACQRIACRGVFILIVLLAFASICEAGDSLEQPTGPYISIEFNTLEGFEQVYFPKISAHTKYSIISEGGESYLKAFSNSSASALAFTKEFDVYEHPRLSWRWRVSNVLENGNAGIKSGDDFPARLYVMFRYDPAESSIGKRIVYATLKAIYGKYPPHSTLNYIWANRTHGSRYIASPYTRVSKMVVLREGLPENINLWTEESVNVLEDYREAFKGKNPPRMARIAVMSDSDNTKESAIAHFDSIAVTTH